MVHDGEDVQLLHGVGATVEHMECHRRSGAVARSRCESMSDQTNVVKLCIVCAKVHRHCRQMSEI